ncbi:hypothetical protein F2Q69_00019435 [Brassica cretica]|uniref:Uncharacterized protein n=1 Tax=Brassica cretica TaxID=69181 RepID=A0A8S9Q8H9_BRACR|nr:hypothetical protein F2Q69_00019435 [Brassica cretica]
MEADEISVYRLILSDIGHTWVESVRGDEFVELDPNPDPDIRRILQFLGGYPTPGYPRTPDPDKDSKIMDPPDKDPDPDTLKLPGYPIRPRPTHEYYGMADQTYRSLEPSDRQPTKDSSYLMRVLQTNLIRRKQTPILLSNKQQKAKANAL